MRGARLAGMKKKIRDLPLFPFLPFGPLLVGASLITLEGFLIARLSRIARSLESLVRSQPPPVIPA